MTASEEHNRQDRDQVTQLLNRWSAGDLAARDQVVPLLYDELRQLARQRMSRERLDHTLQGTALVNEAFMRLSGQRVSEWDNRQQFLALASQMMRRILVDHARQRAANKRGSGADVLSLDDTRAAEEIEAAQAAIAADAIRSAQSEQIDLVAVDVALTELSNMDPQQGRIVELRYFGGLTIEETAEVLGSSTATIKREWALARAWLSRELAS